MDSFDSVRDTCPCILRSQTHQCGQPVRHVHLAFSIGERCGLRNVLVWIVVSIMRSFYHRIVFHVQSMVSVVNE